MISRRPLLLGAFAAGLSARCVSAEPAQTPQPPAPMSQSTLMATRADCGAPAMAAAAIGPNDRHIVFADGLRQLGRPERTTTTDKWHIGSMTKSMTATLVARAVEAGLVSWDDTVGGVLGSAIPEMREDYRSCSFRHLLCHRAGLQPNPDTGDFSAEIADPRPERILWSRIALQQQPVGPKETTYQYSNSGFVVAATMLEARAGASWESMMRQQVFGPLGMTEAGFGPPGLAGAHDQPVGHMPDAQGHLTPCPPGDPNADNPAAVGPAGRVHASLGNLMQFLAAHRDGATPFLTRASWDTLHTPPFGGEYAMGWIKRGDVHWHNGSNGLWYTEMMFDPSRGLCAAVGANDGRVDNLRRPVGRSLFAAAIAAGG